MEKCLAPGSSDAFTVEASNLDTAQDYTVTLSIESQKTGRFGFDAGCATTSQTYDSADSASAITQSPTIYACRTKTAIGVLHATLAHHRTEGEDQTETETEISRTSDYLLFIIPPPQSGGGPRGPGITHAPSASVSPKPTSLTLGQTTNFIVITLSGLDFGHAGGMEFQSSNNSVVGHAPSCSAGLARTWSRDSTSRSYNFKLKACAYGSATMSVTAYQEDQGGGNIHAHGTIEDWDITVPDPRPPEVSIRGAPGPRPA